MRKTGRPCQFDKVRPSLDFRGLGITKTNLAQTRFLILSFIRPAYFQNFFMVVNVTKMFKFPAKI